MRVLTVTDRSDSLTLRRKSAPMAEGMERSDDYETLRRRMLERPEEFLRLVTRAERESGAKLGGDRYKRPKPCPDERLTPYFSLKNFIAIVERAPDDLLFSPELADEVCRVLRAWLPLYEFCMRI